MPLSLLTTIIGGGPSLKIEQVEACRGNRVVAINDAYRLAPWADHLHSGDLAWWRANPGALAFAGTKSAVRPLVSSPHIDAWLDELRAAGVEILQATGDAGYDPRPGCVRTGGGNSGYQAVHREVQLGAVVIQLLGFDMRPGRWHDRGLTDPHESDFAVFRARFAELAPILSRLGVRVVNCTPGSALECFPRGRILHAGNPAGKKSSGGPRQEPPPQRLTRTRKKEERCTSLI